MNAKTKRVFEMLKSKGCPVKRTDQGGGYSQYEGEFCISAEECESPLWLDYYPMSYTKWEWGTFSDELMEILEANGLWIEWYNPAVAVVYTD